MIGFEDEDQEWETELDEGNQGLRLNRDACGGAPLSKRKS